MISIAVFVFGLAVGSFLNAFMYRLEVQQKLRQISHDRGKTDVTVLRKRSFCPSCSHQLAWHDLIPLLSFLLLQGRCRYCKAKISFQYPLVELATAFLFLSLFLLSPWLGQGVDNLVSPSFYVTVHLAYLWVLVSALVVIFVYDLKHFLIPDKILFPVISLTLLWRAFEQLEFGISNLFRISNFEFWISLPLVQSIAAGIGASLFFFAIYVLSKGKAMGFGDVKLALFMGLFLGFPAILVALAVAFTVGALVGLAFIVLGKKTMRSEVPFGPFLVAGTLAALFWEGQIVDLYLRLLIV